MLESSKKMARACPTCLLLDTSITYKFRTIAEPRNLNRDGQRGSLRNHKNCKLALHSGKLHSYGSFFSRFKIVCLPLAASPPRHFIFYPITAKDSSN